MNAPLCRSCRRPLRPGDAFCQVCGTQVPAPTQQAPQQAASEPLPYGAIPQGDPFAALGSTHRAPSTRGRRTQGGPPGVPGRTPRTRRGSAGMIAGVLCAILIVAGVGITALVVGTGGDDSDDEAYEPGSSQPGTGGPSDTGLPSPSGTSTTPSKTFTRTTVSGGDEDQIRQLTVDWSEWLDSIYAGDVGACDYMDLYVVTVPKKSLVACRRSAATPLPDGDTISTKPGKITVNGTKGTVKIKYNYVFDGEANNTSTEADVIKKNGTWYFTQT